MVLFSYKISDTCILSSVLPIEMLIRYQIWVPSKIGTINNIDPNELLYIEPNNFSIILIKQRLVGITGPFVIFLAAYKTVRSPMQDS